MNDDYMQDDQLKVTGPEISGLGMSIPASISISDLDLNPYLSTYTTVQSAFEVIDDRLSLIQRNCESCDETDVCNLLLLLSEEDLLNMLLKMDSSASGRQVSKLKYVISYLIRHRHFSENFLLSILNLIEDKNDLLVVHRYDIVSGNYNILKFNLHDNDDVADI